MRAAARFRDGKALVQTALQPAVDALLAERLMSSALAGPSTACSLAQLAQRLTGNTKLSNLGQLARCYATAAGRHPGMRKTASCIPSQVSQRNNIHFAKNVQKHDGAAAYAHQCCRLKLQCSDQCKGFSAVSLHGKGLRNSILKESKGGLKGLQKVSLSSNMLYKINLLQILSI